MSGTMPTTVGFSTINFKSTFRTLRSISQSGKRQVRSVGAHKWSFSISYPPMTKDEFLEIYSFIMKQNGMFGSFTVIPTDRATARGVATGTPLVVGAHAAGSTAIFTDGFTANTTNIMREGDFIKFLGHDKVYMVVNDENSAALGVTSLSIEPKLAAALIDNEIITVNNVPFKVELTKDAQSYSVVPPIIYSFSLSFMEVL